MRGRKGRVWGGLEDQLCVEGRVECCIINTALNHACVLNFEDDAEELHVVAGSDQVEHVRTIAIAAPHERPSFFSSLLSY